MCTCACDIISCHKRLFHSQFNYRPNYFHYTVGNPSEMSGSIQKVLSDYRFLVMHVNMTTNIYIFLFEVDIACS